VTVGGAALRDVSYSDSLSVALLDPNEASAYLTAALEQDDAGATALAFRHVAQAHGLALVDDGEGLRLSDVGAILRAVGLRLSVQPAKAIP
jgi:DNA-binding phage protein